MGNQYRARSLSINLIKDVTVLSTLQFVWVYPNVIITDSCAYASAQMTCCATCQYSTLLQKRRRPWKQRDDLRSNPDV